MLDRCNGGGRIASWQDYYDAAFEAFLEENDPDDWAGREAEYCIAQDEYACEYADACTEDDDDDDWEDDDECDHPSSTQGSDGAYRCNDCGRITYDISDEEFAQQNGGNYSSSDFRGW